MASNLAQANVRELYLLPESTINERAQRAFKARANGGTYIFKGEFEPAPGGRYSGKANIDVEVRQITIVFMDTSGSISLRLDAKSVDFYTPLAGGHYHNMEDVMLPIQGSLKIEGDIPADETEPATYDIKFGSAKLENAVFTTQDPPTQKSPSGDMKKLTKTLLDQMIAARVIPSLWAAVTQSLMREVPSLFKLVFTQTEDGSSLPLLLNVGSQLAICSPADSKQSIGPLSWLAATDKPRFWASAAIWEREPLEQHSWEPAQFDDLVMKLEAIRPKVYWQDAEGENWHRVDGENDVRNVEGKSTAPTWKLHDPTSDPHNMPEIKGEWQNLATYYSRTEFQGEDRHGPDAVRKRELEVSLLRNTDGEHAVLGYMSFKYWQMYPGWNNEHKSGSDPETSPQRLFSERYKGPIFAHYKKAAAFFVNEKDSVCCSLQKTETRIRPSAHVLWCSQYALLANPPVEGFDVPEVPPGRIYNDPVQLARLDEINGRFGLLEIDDFLKTPPHMAIWRPIAASIYTIETPQFSNRDLYADLGTLRT